MPPTGLPCLITIVVTLPWLALVSSPLPFLSTTRRTIATTTTTAPRPARIALEFIFSLLVRGAAEPHRFSCFGLGSQRRWAGGDAEGDQETAADGAVPWSVRARLRFRGSGPAPCVDPLGDPD